MTSRCLCLLSLLVAAGCGARAASEPVSTDAGARAPAAVLDVVPVISQKLDKTIRLPGELSAFESVALYPRVGGFVEEVPVDRGSKVKRGQLLVRLAAPELASQRAEAEANATSSRQTFERLA